MTDPKVVVPKAEVDKRQVIFDALSKDDKYKNYIPKDVETFFEKMSDPKVSDIVHTALSKDEKYAKYIPDSTVWSGYFVKKKGQASSEELDAGAGSQLQKDGEAGKEVVVDTAATTLEPIPQQVDSTTVNPNQEAIIPKKAPVEEAADNRSLKEILDVQPLQEEPESTEINPEIDSKLLSERIQGNVDKRQKEAEVRIREEVQADLDAENLTEEEANIELGRRFDEEGDLILNEEQALFDKDIEKMQADFIKQEDAKIDAETKASLTPEIKADNTSRFTNREVSDKELIENRQAVKDHEETRKVWHEIANKELAKLPTERETREVSTGGALGAGRMNVPTNKQKIIDNTRDALEKISKLTAEESAGFFSGLGDQGMDMIPFIGAIAKIPQLLEERDILNKPENERTEEEQMMVNAMAMMNSFNKSGLKPTSYEWGEMVGQMIPFLGEFAATGGTAAVVGKGIGKQLIKNGLGRGALNYTLRGTGMAITQATINPQQYIKNTIERMTPMDEAIISLENREVGKIIRRSGGEGVLEAGTKAYLSQISEMFTERLGFSYGSGAARFMKSKVAKHLVDKDTIAKWTMKQYAKRKGINSISEFKKLTDRIGFNGVLSEIWGEELPNMVINERITGDRGLTFLETLNPLDENLLKMVVPMLILQGGMYAPTGFGSIRGAVKKAQLESAVKSRKSAIEAITNGAKVTLKLKTGGTKPMVRVDGKWKYKTKAGKMVSAPADQQTKIDNEFVNKTPKDGSTFIESKGREAKKIKGKWMMRDENLKFKTEVIAKSQNDFDEQYITMQENLKKTDAEVDEILENKTKTVTNEDGTVVTTKLTEEEVTKGAAALRAGKKPTPKVEPKPETEKEDKEVEPKNVDKIIPKKDGEKESKTNGKKEGEVEKKTDTEKETDSLESNIKRDKDLPDVDWNSTQSVESELGKQIRGNNQLASQIARAKEGGHINKKTGLPKKNAPSWVKEAHAEDVQAKANIAKLREALVPKKRDVEVTEETDESKIEGVKKKMRELASVLFSPANKALAKTRAGKKKLKPMKERYEALKKERDGLKGKVESKAESKLGLDKLDENSTATQKGKPKSQGRGKDKVIETDYDFEASDVKGVIREVDVAGEKIYYAFDAEGRATAGFSTASDAVRALKGAQPRHISQTGFPHFDPQGHTPSKSQTAAVKSMHTSPKVIRTELRPKPAAGEAREMKIYLSDGVTYSVFITVNGKVQAKTKAGKLTDKLTNTGLRLHPEIIALLNAPNKAKYATKARAKTGADTKKAATITDPHKFTEKAKNWAAKIRKGKVKVPAGSLRSSAGFDLIYNEALEIAATTLETGGQFTDALRAAIKHIRLSDWYKGLAPSEQAIQEAMAEEAIVKDYMAAGIPLEPKAIEEEVQKERDRIYKENREPLKDQMHKLIFDRRMALELAAYRTRLFIEGINIQTNKKEREILPFIIEGTGIPKKLNRPDLEQAYENRDVKKLDKIAKNIKKQNDLVWQQMNEGVNGMEDSKIEDYITHIWDIPANKTEEVTEHFVTGNKWAKQRYIDTLSEGIEKFGLQPRVLDVSLILSLHGSMANNVQANKQMITDLKSMKKKDGTKYIVHRTVTEKPHGMEGADRIAALRNFWVDKAVLRALKPIFEAKVWQDNKLVTTMEKTNAVLKGAQLTISLFHHAALIEAGLPLLGLNPFAKQNIFNAVGRESFGRASRAGMSTLMEKAGLDVKRTEGQLPYAYQKKNQAAVEDALMHGVQIGASMDIRVKDLEDMFSFITKKATQAGELATAGSKAGGKIAGFLPSILEGAIEGNTALLWDYLHDTLKLMAYEKKVSQMPDKYNTDALRDKYKIEVGQFINDSFGGQHWDVLGANRATLQAARWVLLSPDWTLSTLRQAAPVVMGLPYLGAKALGANPQSKAMKGAAKWMGAQFPETAGVRASIGVKFWIKAALMYGIAYNVWNAFNRKEDMEEHPELYTKEEHDSPWTLTMRGNTIGHMTHVFIGRNPDGSELYIREGKQFRELPELILDKESPDLEIDPTAFIGKLGGKAAPLLQLVSVSFNNHTLSGFENFDLKDKVGAERTLPLIKVWIKGLSPFSFSSLYRDDKEFKALDLIFPSSRGMSQSKGVKFLKRYMYRGDWDTQKKILTHAVRNKLDIVDMYDTAIRQFNNEVVDDVKSAHDSIEEIEKTLNGSKHLTPAEIDVLSTKLTSLQEDIDRAEIGRELIINAAAAWFTSNVINELNVEAAEKALDEESKE